jgi:hypothetical protein
MSGAIPPLPNMPSWRGARLPHRDNFLPFMETEDSLPCSQESATGPYPEPDESSPHILSLFL